MSRLNLAIERRMDESFWAKVKRAQNRRVFAKVGSSPEGCHGWPPSAAGCKSQEPDDLEEEGFEINSWWLRQVQSDPFGKEFARFS